MKSLVTFALLVLSTVHTVRAGAVDGPQSGSCGGSAEVKFEGGVLAAVAVLKADSGSDVLEIYDAAGERVAVASIDSVRGVGTPLGLATWTPAETGLFSIRVKNSPGVCVFKTN